MTLTGAESSESIKSSIEEADMLFVLTEEDDTTAISTAVRIGQLAHKKGILTIAITVPGSQHEKSCSREPNGGAPVLDGNIDAIIVLPPQESAETKNDGGHISATGDMVHAAIAGIAESITANGMINLDIGDLRMLLSGAGLVRMEIASASGRERAQVAAERAAANLSMSGFDIRTAHGVLINLTATDSLKIKEVAAVFDLFDYGNKKPLVIVTAVTDNTMGDKLRLTIFATSLAPPRIRDN